MTKVVLSKLQYIGHVVHDSAGQTLLTDNIGMMYLDVLKACDACTDTGQLQYEYDQSLNE